MSRPPGVIAKWARVSDQCRLNHGDRGAAEEACRQLVAEYLECLRQPPGTFFHFVLSIERPASSVLTEEG